MATTAFVIAAAGASTVADGDKGDITVSGSGTIWNIDAGVVGGTEIASSVALAGNPTTTTQAAGTNNTTIATTAYADAKVSDAINNGTTAIAPSQNAVFDALATKQDSLVSSTNIKTVNGTSILGSGDIDLIDDAIVNGETKAPTQNAVFDALALKANSADIPLLTSFVEGEVASGAINGINATYTLANTPIAGSVKPYWNGMKSRVGVGHTVSGAVVTMTIAPETGDTLEFDYRK